jgi:hypothetical protein
LQLYNAFNVIQQKQHEKFYEQHWFYWIMFTIASVTLSLIVILACLHELK